MAEIVRSKCCARRFGYGLVPATANILYRGVLSDRRNLTNNPSQYHNESVLKKYQDRLKVGTLKESAKL